MMRESSMTDMAAYQHAEGVHIRKIHNLRPTSTLSVSSVQRSGTTFTCVVAAYNSCAHNVTLAPVAAIRTSFP